jgi:hypothetical protein
MVSSVQLAASLPRLRKSANPECGVHRRRMPAATAKATLHQPLILFRRERVFTLMPRGVAEEASGNDVV